MAEPPADPVAELVGSSLGDGRYAVSGVIGRGSQGATLEAVDKRRGELVAIKRFQVRGARSWKDVELAEREAEVLSSLAHRLVPRVIEHFEEDGALYLVMEKVDGQTLAELGTIDRREVVRFLHDAAKVLDHLHGRTPRVIHRDIKPGNVIRRPPRQGETESSFVLVDFGSVRAHLEPKGGSTVVGTFGYMAPEQLQGRALPGTDVYAVGVTALRMITGVEPENLPHRGLGIDVKAALGESGTPLVRALSAMVDPDPDRRASRIAPLLNDLAATRPAKKPRKRRREQRDERRARRRERPRNREQSQEWPPLPRAFALLGLSLASVAVGLALRFVVPTLLSMLSLFFGAGLRRAATRVDRAGARAQLAMRQARRHLRGQRRVGSGGADAMRVEEPGARIEEEQEEVNLRDTLSEIEQAMEEAVDEVERDLDQRRRKGKGRQ